MSLLIKNIKGLIGTEDKPQLKRCGKDMTILNQVPDAYIFIEEEQISGFGRMSEIPEALVKTELP